MLDSSSGAMAQRSGDLSKVLVSLFSGTHHPRGMPTTVCPAREPIQLHFESSRAYSSKRNQRYVATYNEELAFLRGSLIPCSEFGLWWDVGHKRPSHATSLTD